MSAQLLGQDVFYLQRFLKSGGLYLGKVDGIWGPKTDGAAGEFETRADALEAQFGRFDPRSERNIRTLQLPAQELARKFLAAVRSNDYEVRIISGTRTYAEQNALFRQGRFGNPGPVVTRARGGESNHNFGVAWDIGIFVRGAYLPESVLYDEVAAKALSILHPDLAWGGNWRSFKDRPHYELPTGLRISVLRSRFEAGERYFA